MTFDVLIVAQAGRLTYEAVLFAASLRACASGFDGRLLLAEPQPGPLWPADPRVSDREARRLLDEFGAEWLPFETKAFGARYPNANKAEALAVLADDRPCLVFDTDTLVTGPLAIAPPDAPTASMARTATWPVEETYGPGPDEIWAELYARFGLDHAATLEAGRAAYDWQRYLYFNAGWIWLTRPGSQGRRWREMMVAIETDPPPCQPLDPWLDQVALPLMVAEAGGGRPDAGMDALDGSASRHWRQMPLFYATAEDAALDTLERVAAPNRVKRILKRHEPFLRLIYQGRGRKARALFPDGADGRPERMLRHRLRRHGFWIT